MPNTSVVRMSAGTMRGQVLAGVTGSGMSGPWVVMSERRPSPGQAGTPAPPFAHATGQVAFNDIVVDPGRVATANPMAIWGRSYASLSTQRSTRAPTEYSSNRIKG